MKKVTVLVTTIAIMSAMALTTYAKIREGDVIYTVGRGAPIYDGYGDGYSTFDKSHITLHGELIRGSGGGFYALWQTAVDDAGNPYTGWAEGDGFIRSAYFLNGKCMTEGWQTIDGRRYYFAKASASDYYDTPEAIELSTSQRGNEFNWREIDGKYYLFRNTGVWGIPAKESVTIDEYGGHKVHWNSDGSFQSIDGVNDVNITDLSSELRTVLSEDENGNGYSVINQLNTKGLKFKAPLCSTWDKGIEYVKFLRYIEFHNDGSSGNCSITEFDFSRFPLLESVVLNYSNISKVDLSSNTEINNIKLWMGDAKKEIILPNTGKEIIIRRPAYDLSRPVFDGATGQNLVPTIYNDFRTVAVGQTILVS